MFGHWKYCEEHFDYTPNICEIGCGTPPTPSLNEQNFTYSSNTLLLDFHQTDNSEMKLPNLQATKHQLIKEGLKVTIQSKRIAMGLGQLSPEDLKAPSKEQPVQTISSEDEERRRRRRERNKIAATKCRNKKKFHVTKLSQESLTLEEANCSLQNEILNLKREQQKLLDVLNTHSCCFRQQRKHLMPPYLNSTAVI
ncbi:protein fosB-like protein [Dinothrombium tinctorium]|uniref:Protein fosB-like protein n=1 Tax=Dinothrombium tinctorium TaxID=1965070 RepID=A0A443R9I3_9ACAR|nr:protein fosB-like protein [Dinothrombium tinctorium]